MYTTDEIGNPIHVLPEGAYCMLKGAFLDAFEDCPSCQFDRFGDQCVPAICEYYTEDIQKSRYRLFLDMDGVLAQYLTLEEIGSIQRIYEPGYFKNLPVLTGMTQAVRMLRKEDPDVEVHILSSVLPEEKNPSALSEKKLWLSRFFPVEEERQHFVQYREGMSCKGEFAENKTDVLIDDDIVNLRAWEENGGTGILMINEVRLKGWWSGQKLYYTPDPHIMLERLKNELGKLERRK